MNNNENVIIGKFIGETTTLISEQLNLVKRQIDILLNIVNEKSKAD